MRSWKFPRAMAKGHGKKCVVLTRLSTLFHNLDGNNKFENLQEKKPFQSTFIHITYLDRYAITWRSAGEEIFFTVFLFVRILKNLYGKIVFVIYSKNLCYFRNLHILAVFERVLTFRWYLWTIKSVWKSGSRNSRFFRRKMLKRT